MLRRLRPTRRDLASVAAIETDAETGALLRTALHSQRLLLLRAVLDAADRCPALPGPLPPPAAAWDLLVSAERRDRAAVRTVLCHPPVGTWAAYVLRRLRQSGVDPATLCGEVGHLHTIAVTAAIRAGLTFRHPVPVRDGAVVLPTLGMARFASRAPWDVADAGAGPDGAWINGPGGTVQLGHGAGWAAMRRVRVAVHSHRWDVRLDDLDPYRGFDRPLAPDPLPEPEFQRWRAGLDRAWALLVTHHPAAAEQLHTGLTVLIPRPRGDDPHRVPGASCADGIGAAALGLPDDPVQLAAILVRELWHTKLNALLELVPLYRDDGWAGRYAPWRDEPRPISGLLHGCYAFVGVTEFWRRHALATREPLARFEFALHAAQVRDALGSLAGSPLLTESGRYFVAELAATADGWQSDAGVVGGRIAELAHRAVLDHRITWRLRHLRPEPARVVALAAAWRRGAAAPDPLGEPELRPDTANAVGPGARTNLIRLLLRDPVRFTRLVARPGTAARQVPGATAADVSLVAGEPRAAAAGYRARIAELPTDLVAWAGLALTAAAGGGSLPARVEWVRALHQHLITSTGCAPDPVDLAGWLAGAAPLAGQAPACR